MVEINAREGVLTVDKDTVSLQTYAGTGLPSVELARDKVTGFNYTRSTFTDEGQIAIRLENGTVLVATVPEAQSTELIKALNPQAPAKTAKNAETR